APTPVSVQPKPITMPNTTVSPITGEDPLVATKQLAMIEEMLKKGEAQRSPALLRIVKRIAETVGKDTFNGLKAVLLAAEIEDTLQQKVFPLPTLQPAAATQIAPTSQSATMAVAPATTPPQPVIVKNEDQEKESVIKNKARAAVVIKTAMTRAAQFQYADATAELDRIAQDADAQTKHLAKDFTELINQEQAFFLRCRKRLLDEIERHPRKESPLQVSSRKKEKDSVGGDILDFDEKGLKVSLRRGSGSVADVRVYKWEKVPPVQALNLLQNLADKNNVDDQLSVAIFCFNRGLSADCEGALEIASGLSNGKKRSESIADIYKTITDLLAHAK
ncbi:MAG: hypothetical protein V1899_07265, partial [Planctomycetota bacterium]